MRACMLHLPETLHLFHSLFFFALCPGRSVVWVMAVPFLGCFDLAEAQGQPDRFDILMHCLMAGNSKWQPSL